MTIARFNPFINAGLSDESIRNAIALLELSMTRPKRSTRVSANPRVKREPTRTRARA